LVEFIFRLEKRLELFLSIFLNLNAAKHRVGLSWRLEKFLSYFLSEITKLIYYYFIRHTPFCGQKKIFSGVITLKQIKVIFVANATFSIYILPSPNRPPLAWAVRRAASLRRNA